MLDRKHNDCETSVALIWPDGALYGCKIVPEATEGTVCVEQKDTHEKCTQDS